MSEIEVVKPVEHEGIELYVSADKTQSGMSISGLSRFVGVHYKTLSNLLFEKLDENLATDVPERLKPFVGKAFVGRLTGNAGGGSSAKIVSSNACEAIIYYYAFESERISKQTKQNAINAYRKFAQYGLHNWICKAAGFIEDKREDELLSMMKKVLYEVTELRQVATEYKVIRERTTTYLPGANDLLDEIKDEKVIAGSEDAVSLEKWLYDKGVTLNDYQFRRLAHIVCDTYRSLTKKDPEKAHCKVNGKMKYNVSVFKPEHFPILQIGLNKLLA